MATPEWDLYRAFLAVLDTGSLSGAARRLGLTQPTLGRQIEALERALGGQALFTRSPSGLRPTDASLALRPHAEAMAAAAEALLRTASGAADEARGVVRVTTSQVMGAEVLPEILARFHEDHPEIAIELVLSDRQEDLLRRDADIAVRMARPTQAALTARRIGAVPVGLFAHRRYLERHGAPASLGQAGVSAIGFDRNLEMLSALRALDIRLDREMFALRSDSDVAQMAALRAGFGVGACQYGIARRDPNLVPVLVDSFRFDLECWVAMHEDLRANLRMRLMFDALAEGLKAYVAASRA
ncbi:MAG TPA: LysR family transcriptional regulator [Caulobacteraceae bacterium]|nr:LysR family transcriptional regulator [Caulobacteraceae bacterium]